MFPCQIGFNPGDRLGFIAGEDQPFASLGGDELRHLGEGHVVKVHRKRQVGRDRRQRGRFSLGCLRRCGLLLLVGSATGDPEKDGTGDDHRGEEQKDMEKGAVKHECHRYVSILFNNCKVAIIPKNQQFMAKLSAGNGSAGGFN